MLSQCPRCASPRPGESQFCPTCGFDFGSQAVGSAPASDPAAQPQWAPTPPPPTQAGWAALPPQAPEWGTPPPPPAAQPQWGAQPAQPQWGAPPPPAQPEWGTPPPAPAQPQWGAQPAQPQWGTPPPPPDHQWGAQPAQPQWGAPAAPQAPQGFAGQSGAAGTCPRCYAQLYPGYPVCSNCGLDLRGSAAPQPMVGAPTAKRSNTPLILAAAGIVLVLGAGGLFLVASQKNNAGASPSAGTTATIVAKASSTPTSSATGLKGSPAPTQDTTTPEPAPAGTWTKFTAPDGTWSAQFPGTTKPAKQTQSAGTSGLSMTYWYVTDTNTAAVYAVYVMDGGKSLSGMGPQAFIDYMSTYMSSYLGGAGGTTVSTKDVTIGSSPAKEFVIEAKGMVMTMRLGLVGSKMYMLLEGAAPGAECYPQYFMSSFAVK